MEFTPPDQIRNFCFNITSEMETLETGIEVLKNLNDDKECLNNLYNILENGFKKEPLSDSETKIVEETVRNILRRNGISERTMKAQRILEFSHSKNPSKILASIKEVMDMCEGGERVLRDKINTSLASFISYKNKLNLKLSEIHKAINNELGDINESKLYQF